MVTAVDDDAAATAVAIKAVVVQKKKKVGGDAIDAVEVVEQNSKRKTAHGSFTSEFGLPKSFFDQVPIAERVKRKRKTSK